MWGNQKWACVFLSLCSRRRKVVCVLKSYTPRPDASVPGSPAPSERAPLTEHAMRLPHSSPALQRGEILIEWKDGSVTPLYEAWTPATALQGPVGALLPWLQMLLKRFGWFSWDFSPGWTTCWLCGLTSSSCTDLFSSWSNLMWEKKSAPIVTKLSGPMISGC